MLFKPEPYASQMCLQRENKELQWENFGRARTLQRQSGGVLPAASTMWKTNLTQTCMHCRQGVQEYHMHNAFGALTSLANLQAIAAMQGAANLSGTGGAAALGGNLDFVGSMNRHAGLGGLGGLGLNSQSLPHAPFSLPCLPFTLLSLPAPHDLSVLTCFTLLSCPVRYPSALLPAAQQCSFLLLMVFIPESYVMMVAFCTRPYSGCSFNAGFLPYSHCCSSSSCCHLSYACSKRFMALRTFCSPTLLRNCCCLLLCCCFGFGLER